MAATLNYHPNRIVLEGNGFPNLNLTDVLLELFTCHGTNTTFKHKGDHISKWHQDNQSRRLMIDFVVVSVDLRPYALDTKGKE